jgi:peptidoglycan hydrolase CwlO-like protein
MSDVPEKWWIDPAYDPMQELQDCKREIVHLGSALNQLIVAHNNNTTMIDQLTRQNRQLLELYKGAQREINTLQREIDATKGSGI